MRITGCHIDGFGHFEKFELDEFDHPFVVVLGPNETGKSTLFQFIVTMLYGFSPAEITRHPYRPVNSESLGGTMTFRSGKSRCGVERKLRSAPRGVLSIGSDGLFGTRESIRNRPLSITGDVSREMFESVYALTLHDMVHVSGRAWNSIQDRLLGGLNLDTLRHARDVVDELETEAKRLWRPDRRGRTQDQELRQRLRELRAEARDARERDEALRELNRKIGDVTAGIATAEERARSLRRARSRAERLVPVRARLQRIETLTLEAGDLSELECIPADPRSRLQELDETLREIDREFTELRELICSSEADAGSLSAEDEIVLAMAPEVRAWHSRLALFTQRRLEIDRMEGKLERLRVRRRDLGTRLVSSGWTADAESAVRSVSVSDLREAVRRYVRRREEAELSRARREGLSLLPAQGSSTIWWGVIVIGVLLTLVGLILNEPVVWGPAIAVLAVSAGFLLQTLAASRARSTPDEATTSDPRDVHAALQEVIEVLGAFPLSDVRRRDPDAELASDLQSMQVALSEIEAESKALQAFRTKLAQDEAQVSRLLSQAGIEVPGAPESAFQQLFDRLATVESRRASAEQAASKLPGDRERLKELTQREEESRQELSALRSHLAGVGEGDPDRGIERTEERRRAADRAAAIQEELDSNHPDLPSVVEEIKQWSADLPGSREDMVDLEESIEEVAHYLQEGHAQLAAFRTRSDSLVEQKTVAEIESEISMVEAELDEVRRRRDRLTLLAGVIRYADGRFRERHQPDVIRRASDLVRRLTNERYSSIEVDDEDGSLTIREEGDGRRMRVGEPLSRGTLDQIYLSLRLGLADHLDSAGDRLPLILDEVLVNWDSRRRRSACSLLSELAASRQIFLFTCHEWLADEVVHAAGAHVVKL